jgi:hypothetical protein
MRGRGPSNAGSKRHAENPGTAPLVQYPEIMWLIGELELARGHIDAAGEFGFFSMNLHGRLPTSRSTSRSILF